MTDPKKAKQDFELHCALLVRLRNVPPAKARFTAWLEGPQGLAKLLAGIETPLLAAVPPVTK